MATTPYAFPANPKNPKVLREEEVRVAIDLDYNVHSNTNPDGEFARDGVTPKTIWEALKAAATFAFDKYKMFFVLSKKSDEQGAFPVGDFRKTFMEQVAKINAGIDPVGNPVYATTIGTQRITDCECEGKDNWILVYFLSSSIRRYRAANRLALQQPRRQVNKTASPSPEIDQHLLQTLSGSGSDHMPPPLEPQLRSPPQSMPYLYSARSQTPPMASSSRHQPTFHGYSTDPPSHLLPAPWLFHSDTYQQRAQPNSGSSRSLEPSPPGSNVLPPFKQWQNHYAREEHR